jgi:hypothetical protein
MLCPVCRDVERLSHAWQENDSDTVCLDCEHQRTATLLPSRTGAVSLEGVILNTALAAKLFPLVIDDFNVNQICEEQQIREDWNQ